MDHSMLPGITSLYYIILLCKHARSYVPFIKDKMKEEHKVQDIACMMEFLPGGLIP